jgi:hypothetical protein
VGAHGIVHEDIARIQIVPDVVEEIIACLRSEDDVDVTFGLYFAECLQPRAEFTALAEPSLPTIASLIRALLSHSSRQVREGAIGAFVAFRERYHDFILVMRVLLRSPDSEIRRAALLAASSFLSSKHLDSLLPFRDDAAVSETGGMGGPLRYNLRDFALEIAERIAGQRFDSGDCSECRDGREISWRSWSAFTRWLDGRKKWSVFGT